jgi:hypothetical protein
MTERTEESTDTSRCQGDDGSDCFGLGGIGQMERWADGKQEAGTKGK